MVGGPRRAARTFQELQRKAENIQRAAVLWKRFVDASSETTRLLWADWTATVSQITAHYNQHMQKNIWKHVEHSECSSWQLRTGGNIHPGSPESSKSLTKSSGTEECPCLPWRSDGRVRREANNMKAWLHPASHQRSRLQSVWWCRGQFPGTL